MSRPYSLILPEGGRVAIQKDSRVGVVVETKLANASRAARGVSPVMILNRDSGATYYVDANADALLLAEQLMRDECSGPVAPLDINDDSEFAYHIKRSVPYDDLSVFGRTLVLRKGNASMVVECGYGDVTVHVAGARRAWETFTSNQTDELVRAWEVKADA